MPLEQIGITAVAANVPQFLSSLDRMDKAVQGVGGRATSLASSFNRLGEQVLSFGLIAGGAAAAAIGTIGVVSLKTAVSVEDAFAGVAKTTDGLVDEFGGLTEVGQEIRDEFRRIAREVPLSIEELLAIGELAGQLGVPREALADFTETVAALGATTNLSTEEAATNLARLANIFEIPAESIASNTARVGAAVVDLGNNFATTERDVLAFAERIAGAGKIAGLTQSDILGIGAAMSSVGIEAEAGGTAVQKVLIAMTQSIATGGEDLQKFADATGLTVKEFSDAFEADAAGVFQQFVEELGEAGDDAITVLADLGLQDQRLIRAFLSLAQSGDVLGDALGTANAAFEENTALTEEARKRYQTVSSQIQIVKNVIRDFALILGEPLLGALGDVLARLRDMTGKILPSFEAIVETKVAPAVDRFSKFLVGLVDVLWATLDAGFGSLEFWEALSAVVPGGEKTVERFRQTWERMVTFISDHRDEIIGAIQAIGAVLAGAGIVSGVLRIVKVLSLLTSPIGLIIGAVALLGAAWRGNWFGIQQVVENVVDTIGPVISTLGDYFRIVVDDGDYLNDFLTHLPDGLQAPVQFIGQLITGLMDLAEWIGDRAPQAGEKLGAILGGIPGIIQNVIQFFSPLISGVTNFASAIFESIPDVIAIFSQAINFISERFGPIFAQVIENVIEIVRRLVEIVGERLDKLAEFWRDHGEQIVTGISAAFSAIIGIVGAVLTVITALINAGLAVLQGDWIGAWEAIVGSQEAFLQGIVGAIEAVLKPLTDAWSGVFGNLLVIAQFFLQKIYDATIGRLVNLVIGMAKTFLKARELITAIWDGIIQGIAEKVHELIVTVLGGLADLWAAAKDFLGIQSPSRLFAQAGEGIMEGIAEGARSEAGRTSSKINGTIGSIFNDLDIPEVDLTSSFGGQFNLDQLEIGGDTGHAVRGIRGLDSAAADAETSLGNLFSLFGSDTQIALDNSTEAVEGNLDSTLTALEAAFEQLTSTIINAASQMADALSLVVAQAQQLAQVSVPAISGQGMSPVASLPAGLGGGSTSSYEDHWHMTVHTQAQAEQVAGSYALMRARATRRGRR